MVAGGAGTAAAAVLARPSPATAQVPPDGYVKPTDVRLQTGNVRYHGAAGDGISDDTKAIQAAIDASHLVYFPAGTYKCLSSLVLRNGTHLLGEARGQGAESGNVVRIDSRVVGLSGNPAAIRINAGAVHLGVGITIENIWISGVAADSPDYGYAAFPSYGIYAGTQTNGLLVRNATVTGFTVNVALVDATHCKIDHCYIGRAVNTNLLLYGACAHVKVEDTQLVVPNERGTAHPTAILSNVHLKPRNASLFSTWVAFENCLLDEVAKNGQANRLVTARIDKSEDVTFSSCIVYTPINGNSGARPGGGYGVSIGAGCKRVSLRNVRVAPYSPTSNHVPVQTVVVDAAAAQTTLANVTTVTNGGGDILDAAPDTSWLNVNGTSKLHRCTGARPEASTVGTGAVFYDVSLSKPIYSDGSLWRDAGGNPV